MAQITNKEKSSVEVADILREHIEKYQQAYPLQPDQYNPRWSSVRRLDALDFLQK